MMIYSAKVTDILMMEDYQGLIIVTFNGEEVIAFYLAPYEFAQKHIIVGRSIRIDLWLLDGNAKVIQTHKKMIPHDSAGGVINGQITKCFNPHEFRIDCGPFEVDVLNKMVINVLVGDYIETRGTFQIHFPNTDYSKENVW